MERVGVGMLRKGGGEGGERGWDREAEVGDNCGLIRILG